MNLSSAVALLTDANDSVVVYTNGIYLAGQDDLPLSNGTGLNPSWFTTSNEDWGLTVYGMDVLLPMPSSDSLKALFHLTVDTADASSILIATKLYMSTIDMAADGGHGAVINKNHIILSGEFCASGIAAVRHANGRDWWVFFHESNSNVFVQFILTPYGLDGPYFQSIGAVRHGYSPVTMISRDGTRLLIMDAGADLDVFDLDRCTGLLSSTRHVDINDGMSAGRGEFSPSGRFVYVTSVLRVLQYDLDAADLAASEVEVAVWDSTYDTYDFLATYFIDLCLAPNGKIYISTGNGTHFMHIIDQPDSLGLACNVIQHGHNRGTFTDNSIPSRPNYYLGPVDGTVCDSLGINESLPEQLAQEPLRAFPNPSEGAFTLCCPAQPLVGELEVRDLLGRIVLWERLPQWSSLHEVDLQSEAAGMYQCTLRWGPRTANVRIIIKP